LSTKSISDFWYSQRDIKDALDNSNFGILYDFMIKLTVLPDFSALVERIFSLANHIKAKTNLLKKTLLRKACWQNKHC